MYIYIRIYTWQWFLWLMTDSMWLLVVKLGFYFSQADLMISLGDDLLGQEMKLPKHQTYRTKVRINKTNSPFQSPVLEVQSQFGGLGRHSSSNPLVLKGLSSAQLSQLLLKASQQLKHVHHWPPRKKKTVQIHQLRILTCCQFTVDGILHGIETLTNISDLGEFDLFHHQFTKMSSDFGFLISYPDPSKGINI